MNARDRSAIRAIVKALHVQRNRFGQLLTAFAGTKDMDTFAMSYKIPHGGYDSVDKACMILQAIVGDEITSILDDGTQDGNKKKKGGFG